MDRSRSDYNVNVKYFRSDKRAKRGCGHTTLWYTITDDKTLCRECSEKMLYEELAEESRKRTEFYQMMDRPL